MSRKKARVKAAPVKRDTEKTTFSDALDDDILMKLKAAKKELVSDLEVKEKERQEKLRRELEEKEKNKSFAELLEEFDGDESKY